MKDLQKVGIFIDLTSPIWFFSPISLWKKGCFPRHKPRLAVDLFKAYNLTGQADGIRQRPRRETDQKPWVFPWFLYHVQPVPSGNLT